MPSPNTPAAQNREAGRNAAVEKLTATALLIQRAVGSTANVVVKVPDTNPRKR